MSPFFAGVVILPCTSKVFQRTFFGNTIYEDKKIHGRAGTTASRDHPLGLWQGAKKTRP
jgi:hypothetical protein